MLSFYMVDAILIKDLIRKAKANNGKMMYIKDGLVINIDEKHISMTYLGYATIQINGLRQQNYHISFTADTTGYVEIVDCVNKHFSIIVLNAQSCSIIESKIQFLHTKNVTDVDFVDGTAKRVSVIHTRKHQLSEFNAHRGKNRIHHLFIKRVRDVNIDYPYYKCCLHFISIAHLYIHDMYEIDMFSKKHVYEYHDYNFVHFKMIKKGPKSYASSYQRDECILNNFISL